MKLKPLAEAVLYALAEMQYGPQVRDWPMGIHARHGLVLEIPLNVRLAR